MVRFGATLHNNGAIWTMGVVREKSIYVGEYEHSVDGKGRITIPSKWRFRGDDNEVYLAMPIFSGYLTVYPPDMISRLQENISEIGMADEEGQDLLMDLFAKANSFGCDKQGRINLSDSLRAHAGIKKEAVLVGNFTSFSIWSSQRYRKREPRDLRSLHKIIQSLKV